MIFQIAKKLWLYHLSMVDNFLKFIKIKNFVHQKQKTVNKFAKTPCQITHLLVISIK